MGNDMVALSDSSRNGNVSAAFIPTQQNQKVLARPAGRNDDESEESTMDPCDVYIQEGNNRFMQVEGHPGTVAWKQAIQEATRKFKQSQFRDDHFRHVMKILAGADRDFYAGSLEYGWTKLNPMQIRAKCKQAYNKQIETDDEISSVFTQISRHHQSHASQDGPRTNQVRLSDRVAYNKLTDKGEISSVYTGMSKGRSKIIEARNFCEHCSLGKSESCSAARHIDPSTQEAISDGKRATEKQKTRGFLARLINRKSTKDTIDSSESPRKSWRAKQQGRRFALGQENDSRSYRQFYNGNRWIIEPEPDEAHFTIEEQTIETVPSASLRIVKNDTGLISHVTRPTGSLDIIKDLQEEESRKDCESSKETENELRETEIETTTQESNHMQPWDPKVYGGSGMRFVESERVRETSTTPRKQKNRFTSRLRKGLGFKGVLSRMRSSDDSAQSASSQVLPQKEGSLKLVELKAVQHQATSQKDIEVIQEEVEKVVLKIDEAPETEFRYLDALVVNKDTLEADDEVVSKEVKVDTVEVVGKELKVDTVDGGATDVELLRADELPKDLADAQEWLLSNWNNMKSMCMSSNPCLSVNGCEDIGQAIVEEHGSCYAEDNKPLSMSPFQNEFDD